MSTTPKTARVVPGARRLINSLRDLGYATPDAVADVIDNSIAAGAKHVDVTIHFDGSNSWIRIADNGKGMSGDAITEAMRYGTEREYDENDLGKFGLGMKTASMSQCRRLTVASRSQKSSGPIEARQLDLDYIERTNDWDVLIYGESDAPSPAVEPFGKKRGTVVLWENLDRILDYKDPAGHWAREALLRLSAQIEAHLAMVFHRFISGDALSRKLKLTINGNLVEAWDPFVRSESATIPVEGADLPLSTPSGSGIVSVRPFIVPPKAAFSSAQAWANASGPRQWNSQQGLYIYRANRLIQSGGWSGIRAIDEHTKLSRISIDFSPALDSAFEINVAKMRVALPPALRDEIKSTVDNAVRQARAVYDSKEGKSGPARPRRRPNKATSIAGTPGGTPTPGADPAPPPGTSPGHLRAALESAATAADLSAELDEIVAELKVLHLDAAGELGW